MEAADRAVQDNGKEVKDRSLLVLYGTETGHSQEIAHEIGDAAERLRFRTMVEQMNDVSLVRMKRIFSLLANGLRHEY